MPTRAKLKMLVACEFSGTVREAFSRKGWDAWSCDLLPSEKEGNHLQGDVSEILSRKWTLVIGHPPCTYLANSGVCFLRGNKQRLEEMYKGADFFLKVHRSNAEFVAVENPVLHGYAYKIVGKPSQVFHPFHFGHKETKATCLWLKNLPLLKHTNNVKKETYLLPQSQRQRTRYLSPSPSRWRERSRTFQGMADAMAEQWTRHILAVLRYRQALVKNS